MGAWREGAQLTVYLAAVCKQQPDGCWQTMSQGLGNASVFKVIWKKKGSFLTQVWVKLSFLQPVLKEQFTPLYLSHRFFFSKETKKVIDSENVRPCSACVLIYGF